MAEYLSKKYLQRMIDKWKSQYEDFESENKNSKLRKKLILKGYNECETIIEQAPTADVVEVKHGEWQRQKNGFYFVCSVCEKAAATKGNYCHSCGAKMDR